MTQMGALAPVQSVQAQWLNRAETGRAAKSGKSVGF
jgi:hypothetical protein